MDQNSNNDLGSYDQTEKRYCGRKLWHWPFPRFKNEIMILRKVNTKEHKEI